MKHNPRIFFLTGFFLLLGILLIINACEEKEVPYIDDAEEIRRYIAESDVGRGFFRNDSLVTPDTFTIAEDPGAKYVTSVDSVVRDIGLAITPRGQGKWFQFDVLPNPNSEGWRDAELKLDDKLYLRTTRITQTDTTSAQSVSTFTRFGWFVKLGDDLHDYAGWLLYGFNGGSPFNNGSLAARFDIVAPISYEVRGDTNVDSIMMRRFAYKYNPTAPTFNQRIQYRYSKINDTTAYLRIRNNVSLQLTLGIVPEYSDYMLITSDQEEGKQTIAVDPVSGYYEHTLHVPDSLPSNWYLMVFQELRSGGTGRKIWCVPYRIWP